MAELINREPIVKRVKNFAEYEWNDTRKQAYSEFLDMLTDTPTVTEAEIRAKAISDFLQFVYDNASNEEYANEDGWAFSDLMDLEYKFAEQLKESE